MVDQPSTPLDDEVGQILMYVVLGENAIELSPTVRARAEQAKTKLDHAYAKQFLELLDRLLSMSISGVAMPRSELDKISIQDLRLAVNKMVGAHQRGEATPKEEKIDE